MAPNRLLTIAVIGLLLLNFGTLAFLFLRKGHRPPHGRGPEPKTEIARRLDLDEKQREAYEQLIRVHRDTISALEEDIHRTKKQLYAQLSGQAAGNAADSLTGRLGAVQVRIERIHFEHFRALRGVCRPEQLPAFDSLANDLERIFQPPHRRPEHR
jgi:protein CpxP